MHRFGHSVPSQHPFLTPTKSFSEGSGIRFGHLGVPKPGVSNLVVFRKILVSVKFLSAILGPEMAAPILWTRGKMRSFCRKKALSIKFRVLGGGGILGFGGGGSADFIFMGAGIFLMFAILTRKCSFALFFAFARICVFV